MSEVVPLELQSKIADWRLRAAEGKLTLDEMKEAVKYLRAGRFVAAQASANSSTKKKRAATEVPSAEDMLSDLEGM